MAKNFSNFDPASAPLTITSASNLAVVVSRSDGSNPITLNAQAYNGSAEVDIHAIVETMFEDVQTENSTSPTLMSIQTDNLLQVACKVKEGAGAATDYVFKRGSEQGGAILTKLGYKTAIVSHNLRLMVDLYAGYPKPITMPVNGAQVRYIEPNISIYHNLDGNTELLTFYPVSNNNYAILDSDTHAVVGLSGVVLQTPAHPFYVRWINRYGGWETWMFACNQKYTRALTKNEYFDNRNGESISILKEGAERVEVSSGVVDDNTREELSLMVYSPLIQLYDKATDTWHNIQIDKADTEWMVATPTHELIMSFVLPTPKMYK